MNFRSRPVHPIRWLLLCLALAVLVASLLSAVRLVRIAGAARRIKASAWAWRSPSPTSGGPALSLQSVRSSRRDLESIEQDIRALHRLTAWFSRPISRLTRWPSLQAWGLLLDGGLSAASDVTAAAWWVALATESAIEETVSAPATHSEPLDAALRALGRERPRLIRARTALSRASQGFAALPGRRWLGSGRHEAWSGYLELASLGLDGLIALPRVAEPGQQHTWLVLIQNSDELRATGGFISSVAEVKLQGSKPVAWRYMNSYDVESYRQPHPPAPEAMQVHMDAGVLLFRDANWSPDYPASAEVLAALYRADMGEPVAGIVAIDTTFVKLLLAALGPIHVPQYDVTVTADNVVETAIGFWNEPLDAPSITERAERQQEWMQHRKDFGGALVQVGLDRVSSLSLGDVLQLARTAQQAIAGKHLLAWAVDDPALQDDLRRAGLDGGLKQRPGDYLMVVDSNVGWNKADRYIDRSIDYHVTVGSDSLRARVSVTYQNLADVQLTECTHRAGYEDSYDALAKQCYWNYVRVLVPRGSALRAAQGAEGAIDLGTEGDKMTIGALLVVPPGQSRTLVLEYDLPSAVLLRSGSYALLVQKQPGPVSVRVGVTVELTSGALHSAAPWTLASNRQARCDHQLEADLDLALSWTSAGR